MAEKWTHYVINHPKLLNILFLLATIVSCLGFMHARLDNDYRIYFDENNANLLAHEQLKNEYVNDDSVSFLLLFDTSALKADNLEIIASFTQDAWQLPRTLRVDSLANFMATRVEDDDILIEELVPVDEEVDKSQEEKVRRVAKSHPSLVRKLISDDERMAMIALSVKMDASNAQDTLLVTSEARKLARKYEKKFKNLKVYLSGSVPANAAFTEASEKDMATLFPLMFLIISIMIYLCVRSIRGVLFTMYVVICSSILPMGIFAWLKIPFNTSTTITPLIVLTVAIADSIHIFSSIRLFLRQGSSIEEAVRKSLKKNFYVIFITSLTTAIGFLGLNFGDVPPFRELGNLTALGVMVAFFSSVTVLPSLVILFKIPTDLKASRHLVNWRPVSEFLSQHSGKITVITLGMVVFMGYVVPQIRIQDNLMEYFDESFAFRRAANKQIKHLKGYDSLEFSVQAGEENGVYNPEFLAAIEKFEQWIKVQQHVVSVTTILPVLKEMRQRLNEDDPSFYALPDGREEAAQYLMLYEMSLPFGRDLNNQINTKRSATRVTVSLERVTNTELIELVQNAERWLEENIKPYTSKRATGVSVLFANLYYDNTLGMIGGTVISFALITLTLIIIFRSLAFGLLSLLPNLLPAVVTFGAWSLLVGEIGLIGSTVTALTLGIVVDDTVHFLSHYLKNFRSGMSVHDSVAKTLEDIGDALLSTTVILALGFGVLSFSGFQLNEYLGKLCFMTIVAALLLDVFFLPCLLMVLFGRKEKKATSR